MWLRTDIALNNIDDIPGLDTQAFYQIHETTLTAYGKRKQWWWSQPNAERTQENHIDEYSIEQVMLRLQRYDASNSFIRFFWRLFT